MDETGFRDFCTKKNLDERGIQAHIRIVKEFEAFLRKKDKTKDLSKAASCDLQSFVAHSRSCHELDERVRFRMLGFVWHLNAHLSAAELLLFAAH